jgi:transposase
MPAERTAMRQVRDVLRLKMAGVAINEIARRVGVASSTVRLTLKRLAAAGLGWPLPPEMTDTALEQQLFTAVGKKQGHRRLTEPDWAAVHRELKRKRVRLQILWTSTSSAIPTGIATRGFASFTAAGPRASRSRCDRPMPAATSCSSTTPATRCR